jgi:hypothetical protein
MSQKKTPIEEHVATLAANVSPADLAILAMGFYAGYNGVTMIDYFMKGLSPTAVSNLQSTIDAAENIATISSFTPLAAMQVWDWISGKSDSAPETTVSSTMSAEHKKLISDATTAKIALGCMGAIVAYAFTREGFLPALLGMAGDLASNLTKIPIPV